jgi:hypothetical protein
MLNLEVKIRRSQVLPEIAVIEPLNDPRCIERNNSQIVIFAVIMDGKFVKSLGIRRVLHVTKVAC